ncbi:MAG: hypothetical protein JW774_04155 [Candidatus Aureabacteria bacterium]|nr:hypothetical protein [Candidatus Auribacterota bacterium]
MKKLKLPVVKKNLPRSKSLSMEDYLEFVQMNLEHLDLNESRKSKDKLYIRIPFRLK